MDKKKLQSLFQLKPDEINQFTQTTFNNSTQTNLTIHRKRFLAQLDDLEKMRLLKKCNEGKPTNPSNSHDSKTLFKCKICGSTVSVDGSAKVYKCKKCGLAQAIPDYCSNHISFLYGRANHYFRTKRFDKALHIYQQIAVEAPNDCEAYRSIVLS